MKIWDKFPILFKVLITIIFSIFVFLAFYNILQVSTTVTDGNLYRDSHSKIYVKSEFEGLKLDSPLIGQLNYDSLYDNTKENDIIPRGSLIVGINQSKMNSIDELKDFISNFKEKKYYILSTISNDLVFNEYLIDKENFDKLINQDSITKELNSTVTVLGITPNGMSDLAGLKIGDIITKFNNKEFINAQDISNKTLNLGGGSIIQYEILRENQVHTIKIQLAKFGFKISSLIMFLSGLMMMVIGFYIGFKKSSLQAGRIMAISMLLFGLYLSFYFLNSNYYYQPHVFISIYEKSLIWIITLLFGLSTIFHSLFFFPLEFSDKKLRIKLIIFPYLLSFCYLIYFHIYWFSPNRTVQLHNIFGPDIINYVTLALIIYIIIFRFITSKKFPLEYNIMIKPIRYSLILCLVIIICFINFSFLEKLPYIDLAYLPFFSIPLAYVYVILKYNLLNLNIRVRRNIQYSFLTLILQILLVLISIFVVINLAHIDFNIPNLHFTGKTIEVINRPLPKDYQLLLSKILFSFLSFFTLYLIFRIGKSIQLKIDKRYFRTKFDYESISNELSEILLRKNSLTEFGKDFLDTVHKLMPIKQVGIIFFKDEEKVAAQKYLGFNDINLREFVFLSAKSLVESIKRFDGNFRIDYFSDDLKTIFSQCKLNYVIPIKSKGVLVGALFLGEKKSESSFLEEDFKFLNSIASQTAVAIENALLYEDLAERERIKHELDIARRIQLASLPQEVPTLNGMDISGISLPALEVGGDFFDYLPTDENNITIVIGDVSGKGTSAALYMSKAQGVLRTLHEFNLNPREMLSRVNKLIFKYLEKSSFITAICANISYIDKTVTLSRAGHLPVYVYRHASQEVEKILPKGLVLGLSNSDLFERNLEEVKFKFASGDVLLFITDGVIEARNRENEEFEEENLIKLFKIKAFNQAEQIRNMIINSVQEFTAGVDQYDDITVVVVKMN